MRAILSWIDGHRVVVVSCVNSIVLFATIVIASLSLESEGPPAAWADTSDEPTYSAAPTPVAESAAPEVAPAPTREPRRTPTRVSPTRRRVGPQPGTEARVRRIPARVQR